MHPSTSQQNRKRIYRSIQYRSVSSDIKTNKIMLLKQKVPLFEIMSNYTGVKNQVKRNSKKPFRFYQNSNQLTKSVDLKNKSIVPKQQRSYLKHNKYESSILVGENPQDYNQNTLRNSSYLETFQQLMEIQTVPKFSSKKIGPLSQKIKSWKDRSHINRIVLPSIIQYENSTFTALDPINLPIQNIQQSIQRLRSQMSQFPTQMQQISHSLRQMSKKNQNQLEQFSIFFQQKIKKLYQKLRQNSVSHQNHMLISKRQVFQLEDYLPNYKKQFKSSHNRLQQLQKIIFQTKPFQLQYQKNYNQSDIQQEKSFNSVSLECSNPINEQKSSYF